MIDRHETPVFLTTQKPPFSILEGARDDALSPEAAGRILRRVMATIRAQQEAGSLARLSGIRYAEADTFAPELDERVGDLAPFYATRLA